MPQPLSLDYGRLTEAQKDQYWSEGFLFPIQIMPAEEASDIRAGLEQIERDWLAADLPKPLMTYKRNHAHMVMPLAAKLATDARILDAVEGILGPDLMIWSAEFFIKEPHTKHVVGMHQDLTYWGLGETSDQVTAWVALSPATVASGCMDFVKSSHKNPIMPHNDTFAETNLLSRGQEIAVDVREEDKTHIELQPGQISLHHGLTFHGSGPNVSGDRRIGFAIRYINPNARQEVADRDFAMMARGTDTSGAFIHVPTPTGLFATEALALHHEIQTEQTKALAEGLKKDVSLYQGLAAAND
ncbi:phytanoyl-CoA dioxygenase family protein [Falsiruegeria mediterranea]